MSRRAAGAACPIASGVIRARASRTCPRQRDAVPVPPAPARAVGQRGSHRAMQLARLVPVEVAWALGGKAEPIARPKQTTAFHRVEKAVVERQPEHAVQVIEQRGGAE